MKHFLFTCLMLAGLYGISQVAGQQHRHSVTKLWETDTVIKVPESVLPDFKNHRLYVSLIDGDGWAKDGKGGIGILLMNGRIISQDFVTGLNAPKGIGALRGKLFAADIDEVAVINLTNGQVEKKIPIPGSKRLNDIAVDNEANAFYVSDSKTGIIWKVTDGVPERYLSGVDGANGLKCTGDALIFAKGKSLWKADKEKHLVKIADVPYGIDGIELVGNGDYLVSAWAGYLYYISADGQRQTLLETHAEKKNAADIGYDRKNSVIYIPSFNGKTVAAYQLQ